MKNNQFKKIIRQEIENECETFDFVSVAVDESNNSRMIYIFTLDWVCVGMFSCWLNNERLHLQFTTNLEKPMIVAKEKEVNCKYTEFNKVLMFIQGAFEKMDKTN